jgi:hypothetical protein
VFEHVKEIPRGVGDDSEWVDALGEKRLLLGENAVSADREFDNVGVLAGVVRGAIAISLFIRAPVQNIEELAAGDQGCTNWVCAA